MMNGTAVLPAVVTTFAGNAATISAGSVQNGSASGTAGGFYVYLYPPDEGSYSADSLQYCLLKSAHRIQ